MKTLCGILHFLMLLTVFELTLLALKIDFIYIFRMFVNTIYSYQDMDCLV